jgi:hypothetical protein
VGAMGPLTVIMSPLRFSGGRMNEPNPMTTAGRAAKKFLLGVACGIR